MFSVTKHDTHLIDLDAKLLILDLRLSVRLRVCGMACVIVVSLGSAEGRKKMVEKRKKVMNKKYTAVDVDVGTEVLVLLELIQELLVIAAVQRVQKRKR